MQPMIKTTRIMLIAFAFVSAALSAVADRGIGKKSKTSKITLNISTPSTIKSSLSFNLKNGLKYTGAINAGKQVNSNSMLKNTLVTYQKGNTTYIIPYKQKIVIPEVKQGYTGMKVIIRPH
jgi:hypothetical protein